MTEHGSTTDAIDHRITVTAGWLTDEALAADLGVSVYSVRYRMTWLPHMRIGSKRYFDPQVCRAAIIARSQKNEEPRRPGRPRKAA